MLDGLDEVADPQIRKQVVTWVEQCMASMVKTTLSSHPAHMVIKSNPLANVTVLQVRPFTSQQVEQFVNNWYLANEIMSSQKDDPGVREAGPSWRRGLARTNTFDEHTCRPGHDDQGGEDSAGPGRFRRRKAYSSLENECPLLAVVQTGEDSSNGIMTR